MTPDRLAELATLDPGDMPDDAIIGRVDGGITARDLRDFVSLLPVVHAAILETSGYSHGDLFEALAALGLAK